MSPFPDAPQPKPIIKVDPERASVSESGSLWLPFYFDLQGPFPGESWADPGPYTVAKILETAFMVSDRARISFMDGPYSVDVVQKDELICVSGFEEHGQNTRRLVAERQVARKHYLQNLVKAGKIAVITATTLNCSKDDQEMILRSYQQARWWYENDFGSKGPEAAAGTEE